jgi:hypothetical protein
MQVTLNEKAQSSIKSLTHVIEGAINKEENAIAIVSILIVIFLNKLSIYF